MAMGFEKNGSTVDMEAGTGRDETVPDGIGGPYIIRAFVDRLKLLVCFKKGQHDPQEKRCGDRAPPPPSTAPTTPSHDSPSQVIRPPQPPPPPPPPYNFPKQELRPPSSQLPPRTPSPPASISPVPAGSKFVQCSPFHPTLSPSNQLSWQIISMSPSSSSSSLSPPSSSSSSLSPPSSSQTRNSTWTRGTNITSRSQLLPTYHTDKHQTHPIVTILKELELGKTMLTLAGPLTTGLIFFYHTESATLVIQLTVISLSVGCAAIWNGILFQETYPRTANVVQQLGISFVFLGLYGVVGSFLSIELIWIPGVCFGSCILPLVVSAIPRNHGDEEGARGN